MPGPFLDASEFMASGVSCDNESHGLIIHAMENHLGFSFHKWSLHGKRTEAPGLVFPSTCWNKWFLSDHCLRHIFTAKHEDNKSGICCFTLGGAVPGWRLGRSMCPLLIPATSRKLGFHLYISYFISSWDCIRKTPGSPRNITDSRSALCCVAAHCTRCWRGVRAGEPPAQGSADPTANALP